MKIKTSSLTAVYAPFSLAPIEETHFIAIDVFHLPEVEEATAATVEPAVAVVQYTYKLPYERLEASILLLIFLSFLTVKVASSAS